MHVGIANPRWRGKRSRHSWRMHNPQPVWPPVLTLFKSASNHSSFCRRSTIWRWFCNREPYTAAISSDGCANIGRLDWVLKCDADEYLFWFNMRINHNFVAEIYLLPCSVLFGTTWHGGHGAKMLLIRGYHFHRRPVFPILRGFSSFVCIIRDRLWNVVFSLCLLVGILWPS